MSLLVVAAHPDDEVLGAGGVMARTAASGKPVHVLILAEGATSRGGDQRAYCDELHRKHQQLMKALGVTEYHYRMFPDQKLDTVGILELAQAVEELIQRIQPRVVITHWRGDLNVDHRLTAEATLVACRPQPTSSVKSVLAMEVPSATGWGYEQFQPNMFVDITRYWGAKFAALEIYRSEMRDTPHARSFQGLRALAEHRGCSVGLPHAEAFEVVRSIA